MLAAWIRHASQGGSSEQPADEVVTRTNAPRSLAQLVERRGNSGWYREVKDLSLLERRAQYQLVGEVMAHQGYDV